MKTKLQLKEDWKQYLRKHPKSVATINKHHYVRTRFASKFWLNEVEKIYQEYKESFGVKQ